MDSVTEDTGRWYMEYVKENKSFLKEFHRVYYTRYKEKLRGCRLSDYMITSYIRVNKIEGYSNYDEFVDGYLLQVSKDKEEAGRVYNDYYWCFIDVMGDEVDRLKRRYNKGDEDVFIAYEIKTVFQFYVGFLMEKILMYHIDNYSCYTVFKSDMERKRYIDDKYAIDVEAVGDMGQMIAIQCKSYTYLNVLEDEKWIHIKKHRKYKTSYDNSETYYILYKNYKPCYYVEAGKKSYWIKSAKVLDLNVDDVYEGDFLEMLEQMEGEV